MVLTIAEVSKQLGRSGHDAGEILISPALLMAHDLWRGMIAPCEEILTSLVLSDGCLVSVDALVVALVKA